MICPRDVLSGEINKFYKCDNGLPWRQHNARMKCIAAKTGDLYVSAQTRECVCPCHTGLFFVRSNSYSVTYAAFLTDHFTCLPEKKQDIRFGNVKIEIDNINKNNFSKVIKNKQQNVKKVRLKYTK